VQIQASDFGLRFSVFWRMSRRGCVKRSKFQTRPLFLFNFIFFLYLGVAALRWVKWRAATVYLGHFQVKKSV
jgi:hypothetical protein